MSDTGANIPDLSSDNLINHLVDIRMPEPVSWWPLATGWWLIVVAVLAAACIYWLRERAARNSVVAAQPLTDHLFDQLQSDGDVAAYCHRMSRLLREAVTSNEDRNSVVCLHGEQWVDWMETKVGLTFTAEARYLVSDAIYQASPMMPVRTVHNELTNWLDKYNRLRLSSSMAVKTPQVENRA